MAIPRNLQHPRDEIIQTMQRIYRYRMTTTSGGNVSIRDGDDIWITPARVDKGNLRREDIVCVRGDGKVEGLHPPSSEFPFHRAIYAARPDLSAVVHAHPVALVAFSICRKTPDTRLFHQSYFVCGEPALAPYALPGSEALATNIAKTFATPLHQEPVARGAQTLPNCVVLENHGVVVGAIDLALAYQRFEALEFTAKTIIRARHLGPVRYATPDQLNQAQRRFVAFDPFDPPKATSHERELRRQLCEFLQRGCRQRLLISTEGSFSVRVDDDSMLITPSGQDRELLRPEDLVLVRGNFCEAEKTPSRATPQHQAIYRKHPDVHAVVFAHPVSATAFSASQAEFDARTIPESYLFLRDTVRVPYGVQYQADGAIAGYVSSAAPAALLENDGVLVVGKGILDAFDRLEVLESTAEALINCRPLGELIKMSPDVITELRTAFKF